MSSNNTKKCFIHIGPPKTGSSSIKHFFRENEAALLQNGLFIPKLPKKNGAPARNHMDLAKVNDIRANGVLRPNARLWPEIDSVVREGTHNILLSSEMFTNSFARSDRLERICRYFNINGYNVVVIAYVRDQPAWLNSWYVQNQKRLFDNITFREYVDRSINDGRADPVRYLSPYIGNDNCFLDLVSFDQSVKVGLERDFISRCGISDDVELIDVKLKNSNAGVKTVYAAQQIMKRVGFDVKKLNKYAIAYNKFRNTSKKLDWDKTPYVAIDNDIYKYIRSSYADSNEQFAKQYFGRSWDELCPARDYQSAAFDPDAASTDELDEIEQVVSRTIGHFTRLRTKERRQASHGYKGE